MRLLSILISHPTRPTRPTRPLLVYALREDQVSPPPQNLPPGFLEQDAERDKCCLVHAALIHVPRPDETCGVSILPLPLIVITAAAAATVDSATISNGLKEVGRVDVHGFEQVAVWEETPVALGHDGGLMREVDILLRVALRGVDTLKQHLFGRERRVPKTIDATN